MAKYQFDVVRRGFITVDGVDNLEDAQAYIEECNPIDEVEWSDFLEAYNGGRVEE